MSKTTTNQKNYSYAQFAKELYNFHGEDKKKYLLLVIFRCFAPILLLAVPFITGLIVDELTKPVINAQLIVTYSVLLTVFGILNLFWRTSSNHLFEIIDFKAVTRMRLMAFNTLLKQRLEWHENENSGNKIHKISSASKAFKDIYKLFGYELIDIGIVLIITTILFALIAPKYLAIILIFTFILAFSTRYYVKRDLHWHRELNKKFEDLYGRLYEFAGNIFTVKSMGLSSALIAKSKEHEKKALEIAVKARIARSIKWISTNLTLHLMTGSIIIIMVIDVTKGIISPGTLVACLGYLVELRTSLARLIANTDDIAEYKAAIERGSELYNLPVTHDDGKSLTHFDNLIFNDATFKYKEKVVLSNFNLTINKGDKLGVVGLSGAGKSTLFKLILGLYNVNSGNVLISGDNVNELSKEKLAQVITIVPQEIEVFNLSFRDNVTMGDLTEFNENRFNLALKVAQCDKITLRLREGIDTLIGEKGVKLSGGERQRLGIARALYRDSQVILFDEATSHLDSDTEGQILKALHEMYADKTVLFIAHRLSTLTSMDKIIVIDKGSIVEDGSFKKLLVKKGIFYKLYEQQKRVQNI